MERRFLSTNVSDVRATKRADGKPIFAGYGAVFYDGTPETEYKLWDDMVERIMPGAFDRAISEQHDVRGLFNHDPNHVLGRTKSGTMKLSIDAKGLAYEIEPGDTSVSRDVQVHLDRGDVSGSSFSFVPTEASWIEQTKDGKTMWIREVRSVDLYDVGPVTFPAYESTTAGVRSKDESRDARESLNKFREERSDELDIYLMQRAKERRLRVEAESVL